jgi:hypothetical protein
MTYVVPTRPGRYEVRESRSTAAGPRSQTLASFRELDDETVAKAQARAAKPPTAAQLRDAALRAGAPIAAPPVDQAARQALRLLARGESLDPKLKRLLLAALTDERDGGGGPTGSEPHVSDAARAATQWIDVDTAERAHALCDLLELADALPVHARSENIGFPRLRSA